MNRTNELLDILANTHLFANIDDKHLVEIASISHQRTYESGDVIFHQGAASDQLYVVIRGEIDIIIDQSLISNVESDEEITISTIRRGEAFGEIALVDQDVRSAGAICGLSDTALLIIPRQELMTFCETHPSVGFRLMQNIATELARMTRTLTTDMQIREWMIWSREIGPD